MTEGSGPGSLGLADGRPEAPAPFGPPLGLQAAMGSPEAGSVSGGLAKIYHDGFQIEGHPSGGALDSLR
jgi:hypothetical protein